jgi:DNA-binding Lrp family transcriptional regulator
MNTDKEKLFKYYFKENKSISDIARLLDKSENGINYWMKKYGFKKRSISEAIYLKNNPNGDPFKIKNPDSLYLAELKGFGLGLYWGEGNKKNKNSVKLANTDAGLINKFIEFLVKILGVDRCDMKFSLQVFNDIDPEEARKYWIKELNIEASQFYKTVTITQSNKTGTCKEKNKYGVVNIYYHNTKLRNVLVNMLPL